METAKLKSEAKVATGRASHYIKTLCRHFSHKVTAEYTEVHGTVNFPFGYCEMFAEPDALVLQVEADNGELLARTQSVVGGHLETFAYRGETIQVTWQDRTT